jgi:hypothetical protein
MLAQTSNRAAALFTIRNSSRNLSDRKNLDSTDQLALPGEQLPLKQF